MSLAVGALEPVPGRLLRILGLGFGLAIIVGAAVGGEILRLPGPVAKAIPDSRWFLFAWVLGGAYAALSVLFIGALQWPGLRLGSLLQDAASAAKGLLLLGLAALGLFLAPADAVHPVEPASSMGLLAFLGAMQLVIFAYDNNYASVYFGEEYMDPARQVPRSLLGGVALVTLLYPLLAFPLFRYLRQRTSPRRGGPPW